MRPLALAVAALAALPGCYCAHRADRFTYADPDARADGGQSAHDASPTHAGMESAPPADARALDSSADGSADGGSCPECEGDTPFCDPDTLRCVECVTGTDCDDGDTCTVDRCSLGTCSHTPESTCIARIGTGGEHTCARYGGGRTVCWGANTVGQLGRGTFTEYEPTPMFVTPLSEAGEIAMGAAHTCARLSVGTVMCWGDNSLDQLGPHPSLPVSEYPVWVSGITDAVEIWAGRSYTCVRREAGPVACWGNNEGGQLGVGSFELTIAEPRDVSALVDAIDLGAGSSHACAVRSTGGVVCWGSNDFGQLGDGTTTISRVPVLVAGLDMAVEVEAGSLHTCARLDSGAVRCWGSNAGGQLGNPDTIGTSVAPVEVVGLTGARQIALGGAHSCALLASGRVECWGRNDRGQLGVGTLDHSTIPVPVAGLTEVVEIAAGGAVTCARTGDRRVYCWGANEAGQLGDGTTEDRRVPTVVVGL